MIARKTAELREARWSELKRALELSEKRKVADNVFTKLLDNLVKAGFLESKDEMYTITDPLLAAGLRKGYRIPES